MKLIVLHPFTSEAAGIDEKDILKIHSRPHFFALKNLSDKLGYDCYMEYFTRSRKVKQQTVDGIHYRFFPVNFKWNGDHRKWKKQFSSACLKSYKKNPPDICIINMSAHSSPFSYQLSNVILRNKKKYIAMLGGQHYSDHERNRNYYKNAHHILVHTHLQKNKMLQMELFQGLDIRVFPLGVDCNTFRPGVKMNKSPALLYVGRIIEWKRIHLAIEALDKLVSKGFTDARLDIIGPVSSDSYYKFLKNMIAKLKLEKNVNFHSQKQHADLVSFYQQADIFTLPSNLETFGMVMTEAMACGTPVAAIDCPGGPKEVIEHEKDGILTSPEDYSSTILKYFENPKLLVEMSTNAREKALESYSLDASYKALEGSINSILNCNIK